MTPDTLPDRVVIVPWYFAFIVGLVFGMTGCNDPSDWTSEEASLAHVPGLQDCKHYFVGSPLRTIRVIRCPNSSTTVRYSCGKHCTQEVTTIDGGQP